MDMTKMILCGLMAVPMLTEAMPSKQDLDKVSPVVADLMKPEQDALKAGKKTKSEVADAALELVKQADGEAAKLLLAKGAFNLYVRDGQFDKALDTLKVMRTEVPDITPQYLVNIIETALRRVSKKNGGQLYQILDETKALARYQDELKNLEAQAKKRPADKALQTKIAEHYAVLGDWAKALGAFVKGDDAKAATTARAEKDGAKDAKAIADFWWTYPDKKGDEFEKPFKQHAAALYSQAVASGKLVGLNKVQAERRIEEAKTLGEPVYEAQPDVKESDGLFCVIDLSGGPDAKHYPVSYLKDAPKGGWTDEYKTTKLVLRRIKPGKFVMGNWVHHREKAVNVTLTRPFLIGVFEVTQRQWELVEGQNHCAFKNRKYYATRPAECICYDMIRGADVGSQWPLDNAVDEDSFLGKIRARTGLLFDLPTEAQWEYACRSGEKKDFGNGTNLANFPDAVDPACDKVARYIGNSGALLEMKKKLKIDNQVGPDQGTATVGSYLPNRWGLYDMHGNVRELVLDWHGETVAGGVDPHGPTAGEKRVMKGGGWWCNAPATTSWARLRCSTNDRGRGHGFRLAIQPPFVPPRTDEKK